ncbi:family 43 glycoside hydrolase [Piromyces sp. E2]|nr:family 43 glycoside hydrolase [Piromyces sp. E2]|eukprot:OUM58549.1 family 43 glycoside hydrolase [Piromyces sp. E2]
MTEESFAKGGHETGTSYCEGPYLYKRNGLYYMFYAAFREGAKTESLAYSTSENPTGPWKYGGVLMTEGSCYTIHPGVTEFNGKNYLFYHTNEIAGSGDFQRTVRYAEFNYNEDGSIDTIPMCPKQEAQPIETQPTETQPAETQPTETQAVETKPVESQPVENKEQICEINSTLCDKNAENNKCFSFPEYSCCEGCNVVLEDEDGKWGYEKYWCGIKDTCFGEKPEEKPNVKPVDGKY